MSFLERLKYTHKRKWFCRISYFGIMFPKVASDRDIDLDFIWRDTVQKRNRRLHKQK